MASSDRTVLENQLCLLSCGKGWTRGDCAIETLQIHSYKAFSA